MDFRVHVTEDIIARAARKSSTACPIALAGREEGIFLRVGKDAIEVTVPGLDGRCVIPLNARITSWIARFDAGEPAGPLDLAVTVSTTGAPARHE